MEQEFNKLTQEAQAAAVTFPSKGDSADSAVNPQVHSVGGRRQDNSAGGHRREEDEITETPKRPKPTTLDIPTRRALCDAGNDEEEAESPDTPSYSSRPLPMSPRGPKIANIPLRRVVA